MIRFTVDLMRPSAFAILWPDRPALLMPIIWFLVGSFSSLLSVFGAIFIIRLCKSREDKKWDVVKGDPFREIGASILVPHCTIPLQKCWITSQSGRPLLSMPKMI